MNGPCEKKNWTRPGLKRLKVGNCARSAPIQKERQNLSLFSLYTVHTEIQVRIVQNSPKSGKNFHESFQKSTFGELWVVSWFKINPKLLQNNIYKENICNFVYVQLNLHEKRT